MDFSYMFRSSPREEIKKDVENIYLSTSYPNDRSINMHNESSYSRVWGKKIVFCCLCPAEVGGETPIANSRNVLRDIPSHIKENFKNKGVRYVRNLFPQMGMPWQEVFQTNDLDEVQKICAEYDLKIEFIENEKAIVTWDKQAIYKHLETEEETWFNHIYFFNKYSFYEEIGLEIGDELPMEMLPSNTFYGDGSEISYEDYTAIKNAYLKNKVSFAYETGDVLFLDNMLTAHGRHPYQGKRIIATAILESLTDNEVRSLQDNT